MINQPLLLFIKQSLSQGSTKEKITSDLLSSGWTISDIEEGFNSLNINTPSINNSEAKISETQTQKIQTQVNHSGNNIMLKIFIGILALMALAVFGFILYKGVIEKNINKVADTQSVNQEQKQAVEQPNQEVQPEKVEAPVVADIISEQNSPTSVEKNKTVTPSETNKVVVAKTGPINCGKDMTCFMNAIKNCSPAVMEQTQTIDIFGINQTDDMKISLNGFNSSKKCIYSSKVLGVNLEYSQEMKDYILAKLTPEIIVKTRSEPDFPKEFNNLTDEEVRKKAIEIPQSSIDSAKSTIGIITKCSFTTTYLTGLYTKWAKGEYSSEDMQPGNCEITGGTLPPSSMGIYISSTSTETSISGFNFKYVDVSKDKAKIMITQISTGKVQTVDFILNEKIVIFDTTMILSGVKEESYTLNGKVIKYLDAEIEIFDK